MRLLSTVASGVLYLAPKMKCQGRIPQSHTVLTNFHLQGRAERHPQSHTALSAAYSSVYVQASGSPSVQFYEVDLPPVSEKKIKLVNAVIPDEKRVSPCATSAPGMLRALL